MKIILGVGGKKGPTLASMAVRASQEAGVKREVIGVARFSNRELPEWLKRHGIEPLACDLLEPQQLAKLPDAANVVVMTLAAVPTYLLARMLLPKRTSLVVSLLAICIPGMAYITSLVPEVLAYPWYALCSWLVVRALTTRRPLDYTWVGLASLGVAAGDWSSASGYAAGQEIAALPDVTAVVAANDTMAMGVIRALHEHGIPVPGQVSVFGWDDMAESKYFIPSLSTVHMDLEALGARSMGELIGRIRGEQPTDAGLTLAPMELIFRESIGPVRS